MTNSISNLKNINILYVEDEESLREITLNILQDFTNHQYVATNGIEGLQLFEEYQEDIDLIITDINMPQMNGLDMVKRIKDINPKIPIIVATAFSNTEYLLEAINIGIDKYVLKPVNIKKLLQVMNQSLLYHELKELYLDNLTILPNRNRLKKDLETSSKVLMALVDIDKFSTINDLYGELNGNKILYKFSKYLKEHFNINDFNIYRVESDKFVISSKDENFNISSFYDTCKDFAYEIEKNAILIDDNEIDINITIGIAHDNAQLVYEYVQRVVNYARKKLEKIMIYDESLNIQESFEENIKWVKQVKNGIKENRFKAYFQPIIDTKTKEIYKYEALIRYIDNDGKPILPLHFLEIARKAKLYPEVIKIMIHEALNLIIEKNKRVAVNISFDDISSNKTISYVYDILNEHKDISHMLEFEILESEEIKSFETVISFITKVKEFGCKVGVDDFGAGYSNFNMLTHLDIDFVKIDGSLIKEIDVKKNQEIIVSTISDFSKKFGFKTVAEFVANESIYNKIKALDIDYAQGYYFGEPIAIKNI